MSIVRDNLMNVKGYRPYCGGRNCRSSARVSWTGKQFKCNACGLTTRYDAKFITAYKLKWHITD